MAGVAAGFFGTGLVQFLLKKTIGRGLMPNGEDTWGIRPPIRLYILRFFRCVSIRPYDSEEMSEGRRWTEKHYQVTEI